MRQMLVSCDKCGKQGDDYMHVKIVIGVFPTEFDLCSGCLSTFQKVLDGFRAGLIQTVAIKPDRLMKDLLSYNGK